MKKRYCMCSIHFLNRKSLGTVLLVYLLELVHVESVVVFLSLGIIIGAMYFVLSNICMATFKYRLCCYSRSDFEKGHC